MQFLGNHNRILILDLAEWQYSPALDLCDGGDPPAAPRIAMRGKAIIIIDLFTMHNIA